MAGRREEAPATSASLAQSYSYPGRRVDGVCLYPVVVVKQGWCRKGARLGMNDNIISIDDNDELINYRYFFIAIIVVTIMIIITITVI